MTDYTKEKLNDYLWWWCFDPEVDALEAVCRRTGLLSKSHSKPRRSATVRALLRGITEGQLAVIRIGDDKDLERAIKTMRQVRKTLATIHPDLAIPLLRIHTGLTSCKKLRRDYTKRQDKQ